MPERISPDILANALRAKGYRVSGPDWRGRYTTTTELCHGGESPNKLAIRPSNNGGFYAHCYTRDCGGKGEQGELGKRLMASAGIDAPRPAADYRVDTLSEFLAAVYYHADGSTRREYRRNWPEDWPQEQLTCPYREGGKEICGKPRSETCKHRWTSRGGQDGVLARVNRRQDPDGAVIVAEGAKAANWLIKQGYNAANWMGGAGAAVSRADLSPLFGLPLILWPDYDKEGKGEWSMRWIAYRLRDVCPDISVVPPYYTGGLTADAADCPAGELAGHIAKAQPYQVDQQPPEKPPQVRKEPTSAALRPDSVGFADDKPEQGLQAGDYYSLGQWYGKRLLGKFTYDPVICAWYRYSGGVWYELLSEQVTTEVYDPFIADRYALAGELQKAGYTMAAQRTAEAGQNVGWIKSDSGVSGGIRNALSNPLPTPALNFLGTPGGVVDLMTGELHDHSPAWGLRGLTAGHYRPEDADYLRDRLATDRYAIPDKPILTTPNLETLIAQVGLTLTGLATNYTALALITGLSGSSKGGTVALVKAALGDYAMAAPENLLERRRGDIDAGIADIIDKRPRMIAHDEIAADDRVSIAQLLGITGNKPLNARRPHGSMRSGVSIAAIWTTAVDIPQWQGGSGFLRRLSVIQTARQLDDSEKTVAFDPDFLDAIVTLGVQAAARCYQDGYIPPYGDRETRKEVLSDMDALHFWLMELPKEWNGSETNKAREAFNGQLDDGVPPVSSPKFASTVKQSGRWGITVMNTSKRKNIRVMQLLDNALI